MTENAISSETAYLRYDSELASLLIVDRTTEENIIWANDGDGHQASDQIVIDDLCNPETIQPRVYKQKAIQKKRTKTKAEVFTPIHIIKKMNDTIEDEFKGLDIWEYIDKTWLEITCGEGPYMCSRYDTTTGDPITINDRVGFVDRKLQRISLEATSHDEWMVMTISAFKASYGYEFQGDSLVLARENMIYTFIEYYHNQFDEYPKRSYIEGIANIVSHNVFQMDGLKYIIPLSDGIDVKIMDWDTTDQFDFKSMVTT